MLLGVGGEKQRRVTGQLGLLGLALALLVVPACSDSDDGDDDGDGGPGGPNTLVLHYDADNANSPFLSANLTYEAAARFTSAQTALLEGDDLVAVAFYIQTVPDICRVKIYGPGTSAQPGALLYSADVT